MAFRDLCTNPVRPVVLSFGSASSPEWRHAAVDFDAWAQAHGGFADFYYVYLEEHRPVDGFAPPPSLSDPRWQ